MVRRGGASARPDAGAARRLAGRCAPAGPNLRGGCVVRQRRPLCQRHKRCHRPKQPRAALTCCTQGTCRLPAFVPCAAEPCPAPGHPPIEAHVCRGSWPARHRGPTHGRAGQLSQQAEGCQAGAAGLARCTAAAAPPSPPGRRAARRSAYRLPRRLLQQKPLRTHREGRRAGASKGHGRRWRSRPLGPASSGAQRSALSSSQRWKRARQ